MADTIATTVAILCIFVIICLPLSSMRSSWGSVTVHGISNHPAPCLTRGRRATHIKGLSKVCVSAQPCGVGFYVP